VSIKDYRVTAGFGLRIVVPMLGPMPIALDFGFPINKGPRDREQIFSFWFGFFN
jgi:outer membrane protein insertion porin family